MKLSSIRSLFSTSYKEYRAAMWHLIALEVLPMLVMLAFGFLAFLAILAGQSAAAVALILIGVVATIVIAISSYIAMMQRIATPRKSLRLRASLEATRPFFIPFLVIVLLSVLFIVLGLALFIIPGIIVVVWLSFPCYALLFEGKKGMEALKVSKEYVRGLWFPIFWRIVALFVVTVVITTVMSVMFEILFGKGSVTDILNTIVSLVISPFSFVYFYQMYLDVKRAKQHPSHEPEAILA